MNVSSSINLLMDEDRVRNYFVREFDRLFRERKVQCLGVAQDRVLALWLRPEWKMSRWREMTLICAHSICRLKVLRADLC
jgi:hypothetical protein